MDEADHDEKLFFSQKAVEGMMAVREKMNKGRVMRLDEPCNTISAHLAKVSLNSTDPVYMVGNRYRRFSTREAARIQSFPDNFNLNSVSQGRQYKAIGNAVPPVLMWYIAKQLEKAIIAHDQLNEDEIMAYMESHPAGDFCPVEEKKPALEYKQINFLDLFDTYVDGEIVNNVVCEGSIPYGNMSSIHCGLDKERNVLISLVKKDNVEQYIDRSAAIYYTGKKFPATVALNKLYYFMPYLKGKGIRDLYFIRIARIGTRKEGQPDEDKNDFRLVFEIEFVGQLFDDYKPIKLDIWRTYTDTTIDKLLRIYKSNELVNESIVKRTLENLEVENEKTHQVPNYTKQNGLDKKKLLNMLQQVVEDAGDTGIMLNEIYTYMDVTLPSNKSADAKKKTLTYLLSDLKAKGIIYADGRRWKTVKR